MKRILSLLLCASFVTTSYATEVIHYKPVLHGKEKVIAGSCWTPSIAVNRPDAWRCMTGNSIQDPCFNLNPNNGDNKLLCVSDVSKPELNTVLKLTKPLPAPETYHRLSKPQPWRLILQDGSECFAYTGTKPFVSHGKSKILLDYGCENAKICKDDHQCGIGFSLTDLTIKKNAWHVKSIVYFMDNSADTGIRASKVKSVAVIKAWQ